MSKCFFTADTHFNHQRTLELSKRPFANLDEMNWELVKRWNCTIKNEDSVIHLGDFGDAKFLQHLNAKEIIFLPGNYENSKIMKEIQMDKRVQVLVAGEFNEFWIDGIRFGLIHEPENIDDHDVFWLFGHIHKLQMIKSNGLNVGVDCHSFSPIDSETVLFYRNAILNHYDKNVFMDFPRI